jgi:hypothetical protein
MEVDRILYQKFFGSTCFMEIVLHYLDLDEEVSYQKVTENFPLLSSTGCWEVQSVGVIESDLRLRVVVWPVTRRDMSVLLLCPNLKCV